MSQKHSYVECNACGHWTEETRQGAPCHRCNNTRQVVDPKEIVCNLCGGHMCPLGTYNEQIPHGLYQAKVMGGYESYHLLDMNEYTFSFCEKCLRRLFIQCEIKPNVSYVTGSLGEKYGWEEDQNSYEYRIWCDDGHHHQAYLDRKCNIVKDCPNRAEYTRLCNDHFDEDCCCEEHKRDYSGSYKLTKFIPNVLKPFL